MIRLFCLVLLLGWGPPRDMTELETVVVPGIERVLRVDEDLLVGASPSPESYRALHAAGVRYVLSVDGKPPDLAVLESSNLRSIHLPIGYEGISRERLRSLVRLVRERPGSIYVHCHHGRHRAPAVAAIIWMLRSGGTPASARRLLEKAGTSPAYTGLWEAVRSHRPEPGACADAPLPERVEPAGVPASMVEIDRLRDRLDPWSEGAPGASASAAVLILEHLRELQRLDPEGRALDASWSADLVASIAAADAVTRSAGNDTAKRGELLERLDATCIGCHARHRN
jgi:protein tyrosine phosphatase (PTP) superfamily phosphohydrolase (DUF442 family)